MAKFWKSKEFENLKKEWDRKLAETGFEDAEKEVGGEAVLKKISVTSGREGGVYRHVKGKDRTIEIAEKEEYFRLMAQGFYQEKEFEDELDRLIMERTIEGRPIKEISTELKLKLEEGKKSGKFHRNTIRFIRRRYETKWGVRKWSPMEMISRKVKRLPTR